MTRPQDRLVHAMTLAEAEAPTVGMHRCPGCSAVACRCVRRRPRRLAGYLVMAVLLGSFLLELSVVVAAR